ncbi:hypothetical protein P5V15_000231 [Pogonomyrmex californicus]
MENVMLHLVQLIERRRSARVITGWHTFLPESQDSPREAQRRDARLPRSLVRCCRLCRIAANARHRRDPRVVAAAAAAATTIQDTECRGETRCRCEKRRGSRGRVVDEIEGKKQK